VVRLGRKKETKIIRVEQKLSGLRRLKVVALCPAGAAANR
jgi:hypothetical protein